ncbi:putative glycosidase CRH2 [Coemansia sp. RSA 1933]|nr:putative glycosidase CRH2 [Coemansia sp. RSA 1933]
MIPYTMADTSADFHDYTFDWSEDQIVWSVDGTVIRTLNRADTYNAANGTYAFPDTRGRVAFSIWDGGNSGAQGTADWAGTPTPWTASTVYSMYVQSITIECSGDSSDVSSADNNVSSADDNVSSADSNVSSADDGASSQQKCIPRPTD